MIVLFRADAGTQMGTGHVMRCLALAQALQDEGVEILFLCATLPPAMKERLEHEGCTVRMLDVPPYGREDCEATIAAANDANAEWIVVDGYDFDGTYQATLMHHGARVLWIDDGGHASPYTADLVLNQNASASEALYAKRESATTLLLGCRFVLLRREFARWRAWKRGVREEGNRILVTLGGSDPENVAGKVLESLNVLRLPSEITVAVGGGNPHLAAIEKTAAGSRHSITIATDVADMTPLMAQADLAIAAGGTTSYELAFLQVPMMTVVLAENQRAVAAALEKLGCSRNLKSAANLDFQKLPSSVQALLEDGEQRRRMSINGRGLVDGEGVDRAVMHLLERALRLRPVSEGDEKLLWEWANDPEIRAASFTTAAIPWEEHRQWFERKLGEKETMFLMAITAGDEPVGSIRFERKNDEGTLSFSLAPAHRGKGLGSQLVHLGSRRFLRTNPQAVIHAYVKEKNDRSAGLFRKNGFHELPSQELDGQHTLHFSMDSSTMPS